MHFEFIFCGWHLYLESTKFKKSEKQFNFVLHSFRVFVVFL
jgi:hypothetical protein